MESTRFDDLTKAIGSVTSRRTALRSALGSLVALGGMVTAEAAKKRGRGAVTAERCLAVGERCPKTMKHGQKKVKHTCEKNCCTRHSVISADGKRRCACRETGTACTAGTARHCCSGVCDGTACAPVTTATVPLGSPGAAGSPDPVPSPFAGTCTVGQDICQQGQGPFSGCNANPNCYCFTTTTRARFCGRLFPTPSPCAIDADCVVVTGPNSACVEGGTLRPCVPQRLCVAPCP